VIPYAAASTLTYGVAATMRHALVSQTGKWPAALFNLMVWVGSGYSAYYVFSSSDDGDNQIVININQGALIGTALALLTLVPGYLKTFCSSGSDSIFSSAWNSVSSGCSRFFSSIQRRTSGGERPANIQTEEPAISTSRSGLSQFFGFMKDRFYPEQKSAAHPSAPNV
jgi:hypothetical protein